jgi:hypothetical protein
MQRKFITQERQSGIDPKDYFTPETDHLLAGYRQNYAEIAARVIDLAHEEKGSHR